MSSDCNISSTPVATSSATMTANSSCALTSLNVTCHRCPRKILDIRWHDFFRNVTTVTLPTSHHFHSVPSSHFLSFFGHLARMDDNTDASQAIFKPPPENWRRPPGQPRTTSNPNLSSLDLGIYETRDLAQNRPLWRLMSQHSQQCMLLLDWIGQRLFKTFSKFTRDTSPAAS